MRRANTAGWLLATTMLAGCSSMGPLARQNVAGPVGPSFVSGKGVQMFAASPTVITDVKDAMTDVGIHSIHQVREPDNTDVLEGTTADNRRAQVAIQPRGTRMVVTTKIGWRGDEALSRADAGSNQHPSGKVARVGGLDRSRPSSPLPSRPSTARPIARAGVSDRGDAPQSARFRLPYVARPLIRAFAGYKVFRYSIRSDRSSSAKRVAEGVAAVAQAEPRRVEDEAGLARVERPLGTRVAGPRTSSRRSPGRSARSRSRGAG